MPNLGLAVTLKVERQTLHDSWDRRGRLTPDWAVCRRHCRCQEPSQSEELCLSRSETQPLQTQAQWLHSLKLEAIYA